MRALGLGLLIMLVLTGCVGAWGPDVPRPVIVAPAPVYVAPPVVVVVEPYYYSPYYCYGCWHGWYGGRYGYHRWD
jgi:hypothetical protein